MKLPSLQDPAIVGRGCTLLRPPLVTYVLSIPRLLNSNLHSFIPRQEHDALCLPIGGTFQTVQANTLNATQHALGNKHTWRRSCTHLVVSSEIITSSGLCPQSSSPSSSACPNWISSAGRSPANTVSRRR